MFIYPIRRHYHPILSKRPGCKWIEIPQTGVASKSALQSCQQPKPGCYSVVNGKLFTRVAMSSVDHKPHACQSLSSYLSVPSISLPAIHRSSGTTIAIAALLSILYNRFKVKTRLFSICKLCLVFIAKWVINR